MMHPERTSIAIIYIQSENCSWTLVFLELHQLQNLQLSIVSEIYH